LSAIPSTACRIAKVLAAIMVTTNPSHAALKQLLIQSIQAADEALQIRPQKLALHQQIDRCGRGYPWIALGINGKNNRLVCQVVAGSMK
jgi:LytS/YehU family sensor histidine kinase